MPFLNVQPIPYVEFGQQIITDKYVVRVWLKRSGSWSALWQAGTVQETVNNATRDAALDQIFAAFPDQNFARAAMIAFQAYESAQASQDLPAPPEEFPAAYWPTDLIPSDASRVPTTV